MVNTSTRVLDIVLCLGKNLIRVSIAQFSKIINAEEDIMLQFKKCLGKKNDNTDNINYSSVLYICLKKKKKIATKFATKQQTTMHVIVKQLLYTSVCINANLYDVVWYKRICVFSFL